MGRLALHPIILAKREQLHNQAARSPPRKRKKPEPRPESSDDEKDDGKVPTDLAIKPINTSKDKIKQPKLAQHENMYIAPIGSSVLISGKSGSGKSTLLVNLLKDKRFYKGFFKRIFWISPTANGDDVQKSLGIPPKDVFTDLEEAPEILSTIINAQQAKLDEGDGAHTIDQYAIVFDDIIGDTTFMNSPEFTKCFYQVRHINCTTFVCTQHFKRVPRVCRLQANFIHYFQGSQSEVDQLVEEFSPPMYTKNEFRQLVHDATKDKFAFLTINMKLGWDKRFRKNLEHIIPMTKLYGDVSNEQTAPAQDGTDEQSSGQQGLATGEGTDGEGASGTG